MIEKVGMKPPNKEMDNPLIKSIAAGLLYPRTFLDIVDLIRFILRYILLSTRPENIFGIFSLYLITNYKKILFFIIIYYKK